MSRLLKNIILRDHDAQEDNELGAEQHSKLYVVLSGLESEKISYFAKYI